MAAITLGSVITANTDMGEADIKLNHSDGRSWPVAAT
jgi:hypothetical protein